MSDAKELESTDRFLVRNIWEWKPEFIIVSDEIQEFVEKEMKDRKYLNNDFDLITD